MAKEVKITVRGVRRDEPDLRRLARLILRQLLEEQEENDGSTQRVVVDEAPEEKAS